MLKILFFGDVCGEPGRKVLKKELPSLLSEHEPDLVLANAENLAHGKGVTVKTLEELIRAGVQAFTSGNHIFSKREFTDDVFEKYSSIIARPFNIPSGYPGQTSIVAKTGKGNVLIGNFLGSVFMEKQFRDPISSPFSEVDAWLSSNRPENYVASLIDFHAEATSEKVAFGYHLDGKVSAVLGTHTHIPTADAKVLAGGTAYITDVGMCGAADSVLGVKKELSMERFLTQEHVAFDVPEKASRAEISYVIIEVDEQGRKALNIRSFHKIVPLK
jgi:2',3'-cyclic-nucleotide 2'-phosphodiesterase